MSENLSRLIAKAKPHSVLLTTYTFSLSYFEAAILPTLRRNGCRNIAVLVDQSHYLESLDESHSSHVGRGYRLIPVQAPGGEIFHPKVAYLLCDEGDTFVVSSGNLTFPGQGGNLECVDAVSAIDTPEVFSDVADFFENLSDAMPDESGQAAAILGDYAKRARQQSRRTNSATGVRKVWLVHTLEQSASQQLTKIAQGMSLRYRRLTVLAPFHAPDGMPIMSFAKALEVKEVAFGLDPKTKQIALDELRFKRDKSVSFVVPVLVDDNRESHAKWFEMKADDGTLVMTGSVNATAQSFDSTSNVEVSLVRWVNSTGVVWKDAKPRALKYEPFPCYRRDKNSGFTDATLGYDGVLTGFVQGVQFTPGVVVVQILRQGEIVFEVEDVKLSENGHFRCCVDTKFVEEESGLQVVVRNDEFHAGGWISSEVQLEATEAERQKIAAVSRVLSDTFSADDVHQVLSMLLEITHKPVSVSSRGGKKSSTHKEPESPSQFSYAHWQQSGQHGARPSLLTGSSGRLFDALYSWLIKSHESNPPELPSKTSGSLFGEVHQGSSESSKRQKEMLSDGGYSGAPSSTDLANEERNQQLMQKLLQIIPVKLAENPSHPSAAELSELVGAFALKNAQRLISQHFDRRTAVHSCLNWLALFSPMKFTEESRLKLHPVAVAMGCAALQIVSDDEGDRQIAGVIKENWQRLGIRTSDSTDLSELCILGSRRRAFAPLSEIDRNSLVDELPKLLLTKTSTEVLERILNQVRSGGQLIVSLEEAAILGEDFTRALRTQHGKHKKKPIAVVRKIEHAGCPYCYFGLNDTIVRRLRQTHISICPDCSGPLIWLPLAEIEKN
jgi:hypothetical protein